MGTERLSMSQTREILRQKWSLGRTHREVAQSRGISTGAVGSTVRPTRQGHAGAWTRAVYTDGQQPNIIERTSRELTEVGPSGGGLSAASCGCAEATGTQRVAAWVPRAHGDPGRASNTFALPTHLQSG